MIDIINNFMGMNGITKVDKIGIGNNADEKDAIPEEPSKKTVIPEID